ncbi:MAG: HAMP domain-containing sensor histidine kinase [Planctomycetia bacterium]|nr:HAMP domain-containing sensor histidine kinase [Planctomycetia bacterium]
MIPTDILQEFTAGAGHELNNPLAAISGRIQLLMQRENDTAKRYDLAAILRQVQRAQEMIADLRLVACPPELTWGKVCTKTFFENLAAEFTTTFQERKIVWTTRFSEEMAVFSADRTALRVLFRALILNALRAIGENGEIVLEGEKIADGVRFSFQDSGEGIPEAIRPWIFDPYYSSYQSGRGLGFGLTKARTIARQHGGEIVLDTSQAQTTFVITLRN